MSRKISLLCILAGAFLASSVLPVGCALEKVPYNVVDPFEEDPADAASNNNDFSRASVVALVNDSATFDAALTLGDVDVYNLGPMVAGDVVSIDLDIPDRILLNAAVAVFDSVGRLFYLSAEDTQIASTPVADALFPAFTPKFDFTVRQTTSPLYMAIASLPEADGVGPGGYTGRTGGPYTVHVSVRRGGPVPPGIRQVVALHFDDTVVDYPPLSAFGQIQDLPQVQFSGLNGRVLDPAWWRAFMTFDVTIVGQQGNAQFWQNFINFVGQAAGQQPPTPAQMPAILYAELQTAIQVATMTPAAYTPTNVQWFQANGFNWLYQLALYLGPGNGQNAGLNIWNTILPATIPATPDARYDDLTVVSEAVRAKLRDLYKGLNIEFLIAGKDAIPTDVPVSSLYFVSNANTVGLAGLASAIDINNTDQNDFAVVWGGELGYANALYLAYSDPNALQSVAQAFEIVGAIGGHELGHILGLVHTEQNASDIMSYSGFQQTLTSTFANTPLWTQMFPIGRQDGYLLLLLELGVASE